MTARYQGLKVEHTLTLLTAFSSLLEKPVNRLPTKIDLPSVSLTLASALDDHINLQWKYTGNIRSAVANGGSDLASVVKLDGNERSLGVQ